MKERLFALQDIAYRDFTVTLLPTVDPNTVIGVRTPQLRAMAKGLNREDLGALPHTYYEENNLHAFYIAAIRDYGQCICELEAFLPYIDNWATCDSLRPKCFAYHKAALLEKIKVWLKSEHTYTVRFAVEMLMVHYLEQDFSETHLQWVEKACNNEYYVNMMVAWYFATALAKQYDAAVRYLQQRKLPAWVHNKTIQKAIESYRITDAQKSYLRTLRIK